MATKSASSRLKAYSPKAIVSAPPAQPVTKVAATAILAINEEFLRKTPVLEFMVFGLLAALDATAENLFT